MELIAAVCRTLFSFGKPNPLQALVAAARRLLQSLDLSAFALSEKGYRVTSMFHLGRRPRTKGGSIRDRRMVRLVAVTFGALQWVEEWQLAPLRDQIKPWGGQFSQALDLRALI
jgi:hypothetical protein